MGSIQERKNRKGEVSYVATLRLKGCPTSCKTFQRRTDAKSWIIQEKSKIQRGLYLDSCEAQRRTLTEAINKYVRQETVSQSRTGHFKRWQKAMGDLFLSTITEVKINNTTSDWRFGKNKILPATINRHLSSLSVLFEAARRWGWVTKTRLEKHVSIENLRGVLDFSATRKGIGCLVNVALAIINHLNW